MPAGLHKDLAREAFESGTSINRICMESLLARKALKNYDPWKALEKIWKHNRKISASKVAEDVHEAILEVRRGH